MKEIPESVILWAALAVWNLAALYHYGKDKSAAKRHKWRTPEKLLLGMGFFGGAVGALAGMLLFRHKTKHWYFWAVNIAGLLWQAAGVVYLMHSEVLS